MINFWKFPFRVLRLLLARLMLWVATSERVFKPPESY